MSPLVNQIVKVPLQDRELEISLLIAKRSDEWVVCLHGIQSNKELFLDFFNQPFLAHYSLLAINLVGFGDSAKPSDFSYDIQNQAEVIKSVLDQLKIDNLHLIGHSLGGMIGTLLLAELGNRVASFSNLEGNLVLADCSISKDVIQFSQEVFEEVEYDHLKEVIRSSDEKSAAARYNWLQAVPASVFYKTSTSIVEWARSEKLLTLFTDVNLKRLYMYGDINVSKANVVPSSVEKVEIPNAGHFMLIDNPDACFKALQNFIT